VSDVTAHVIDEEVRTLIDSCYGEAKQLLEDNTARLHVMAEALMKYETIDQSQITDIMAGKQPRPPEDWDDPDRKRHMIRIFLRDEGARTYDG